MTEYGGGEWIGRSQRRKTVRDAARARFEAAAGEATRSLLEGPNFAPASQSLPIVRLLQVTRDGKIDAELNAFLPQMAQAIRSIGFGRGLMGGTAENIDDLTRFQTYSLEAFFNQAYWFDGPRGRD